MMIFLGIIALICLFIIIGGSGIDEFDFGYNLILTLAIIVLFTIIIVVSRHVESNNNEFMLNW